MLAPKPQPRLRRILVFMWFVGPPGQQCQRRQRPSLPGPMAKPSLGGLQKYQHYGPCQTSNVAIVSDTSSKAQSDIVNY